MLRKANSEGWAKLRQDAHNKAVMKAEQKVADATSQNAVIAERIRAKLLRRIEKEIDALPEYIGTEMVSDITNMTYDEKGKRLVKRTSGGKNYKLRDLTAAYRDLTADMQKEENTDALERLDQMIDEVRRVAFNS